MILPRMSHMVVPINKENIVTQTSIMVSGSCLPYPVHHPEFQQDWGQCQEAFGGLMFN